MTPRRTTRARTLRRTQTEAESILWQRLRAKQLGGLKFRRQQPVGNYYADFFCNEARLIIELDGGHHAETVAYDTRRDAWLKAQDFTVLRFWNSDIFENLDGVLDTILRVARLTLTLSFERRSQARSGQGTSTCEPKESDGLKLN